MDMTNALMDSESLYFGYGSNLDEQDWAAFCRRRGFDPACLTPVGPAWLPDHELVFDYYSPSRGGGALNIRPRVGQVVEGYLFRVTGEGWRALDRKEGAPGYYERFPTVALLPDGRDLAVQTYRACAERVVGFRRPTQAYLEVCRRGRERFGLETRMLDAVSAGREAGFEVAGVFAYGTLMRGEARFALVEQCGLKSVEPAVSQGVLHDFGQWPAMSLESSAREYRSVSGELQVVEDLATLLKRLDVIEGFHGFGRAGSLFRRVLIDACLNGDGGVQRAWAYVMDRAPARGEQIPGGCWRGHRGEGVPPVTRTPMTLYQVQEDEVVPAESPERLVEYLANTSFMPVTSTAEFRKRAAYWVRELFGARVRTATDAQFVEDMVRAGAYSIVTTH